MADSSSSNPREITQALERRLREGLVGQEAAVELLLAALAARAHVILEGPPGTAKTLVAWTLAQSLGLVFKRVQLTPDLMPSDLLGTSVWLPHEGRFDFRAGPLFADVLLADELNRAPPKTQAALLECMQERQITLDGTTRQLSSSFWVVATENPLEQEGTYPLPESELDRFALKIRLDHAADRDEQAVLRLHRDHGDPLEKLRGGLTPLVSAGTLATWQAAAAKIHVADPVLEYIQRLVRATREQADLTWGAGLRGSLALMRCGQAIAMIRGRGYVVPDDVRDLVEPVLGHRVHLAPEAQVAGVTALAVLQRILKIVPVPVVHAESSPGGETP